MSFFILYARGNSKKPRYYANIVGADGRDLADALVRAGLARAFGVFPKWPSNAAPDAYRRKLERRESDARKAGAGLWARTPKGSSLLKPFRGG